MSVASDSISGSLQHLMLPNAAARGVDFTGATHPGMTVAIPMMVRLLADQLTPVLAYRRLVSQDQRGTLIPL